MKVFPLSLADDSRQWWMNEEVGNITTWEELVERFFCKFYPESHDDKDEMLDEEDNWGINPLKFISRVNSSFKNHRKVDGRTKKESDYGNPLNTATDSFFKAHDEHDIEEGNELRQKKRKEDNKNDEQPNKKVCKAEKFKAIKYSLGPNEEYIAIRRCEYNAWERSEDIIMEYLVKISKKGTHSGALKTRHLKDYVISHPIRVSSRKDTAYCAIAIH
ncbi:reverse transcriptase domain-containing protein [Tanacetum coccineum]